MDENLASLDTQLRNLGREYITPTNFAQELGMDTERYKFVEDSSSYKLYLRSFLKTKLANRFAMSGRNIILNPRA